VGKLSGKVAIITGAAGGMGFAATRLFVEEGAAVVAADINEPLLKEAVGSIDGQVSAHPLDVTSEDSWKALVEFTLATYGKVDILVNNAGAGSMVQLGDATRAIWERDLAINTMGMAFGMKEVIPHMVENGGGSIVNTSSCSAVRPELSVGVAYATAKGAVISLTKHVALEQAPNRIRVNAVIPGPIYTEGIQGLGLTYEQMAAAFETKAPLPPHAGNPRDIANAYLFLASDDSSFITGIGLPVDAGNTM
jgi:NAD(P)-dependent dehydrogenase (short-subunit alcohol dehydrogenase family)